MNWRSCVHCINKNYILRFDPEVDRSQVESILRESMLNYDEEPVPEASGEYEHEDHSEVIERTPISNVHGRTASFKQEEETPVS